MGIIKQQTIKGTIFSYSGVVLGFAISGLLMPRLFSTAENGLIKLLIAYSSLFAQFGTLGFNYATARMFSFFRDEKSLHHGYIAILIWVLIIGTVLSLAGYFMLYDVIMASAAEKSSLFQQYSFFLIPLIFFGLQFLLLDTYYKMLFRTVVGTFLKEFLLRLMVLSSLVLYLFDLISFDVFLLYYVISNALPGVVLLFLLGRKGIRFKPDFTFLSRRMVRSILRMSFYGIVMGFSGVMILNIDSVMIGRMLGLDATGIYAITFFFGTLVIIPSRALRKIAGTVLAEAWLHGNMEVIAHVYRKSSMNQFIGGSLIFIGLWANIHNVFNILPEPYAAGKFVIFFIAFANLIEMFSGVSDILIQTSRHYRFSAVLNIVFLVMVVLFNYLLINLFGLTGAAVANALAFALNSMFRFIFIYRKYGIHPFSIRQAYVVLIAMVVYFTIIWLPQLNPYPLDIFVRSMLITFSFLGLIYYFKVSEDLNELIDSVLIRLKISGKGKARDNKP